MKKLLFLLLLIALLSYPKLGQALSFDGSNDVVDFGDNENLEGFAAGSFSAWIKLSKVTQDGAIISNRSVGTIGSYMVFFDDAGDSGNDRLSFFIGKDAITTDRIESTFPAVAGKWYHVVGTTDGSSNFLGIYIDGVLNNSKTTSINIANATSSASKMIGSTNEASPRNFPGLIDEVRIYNRALSAREVRMLYRGFPSRLGLVGYWPLIGNTAGTFEPDFSGFRNHGKRTNGPVRAAMSPFKRFFMSRVR